MIANLEAISNSVSALPAAVSVAVTAPVQRPGGFASALAAARGGFPAAQSAGNDGECPESTVDAGASTTLNLRAPAAGSAQLKKALSGTPLATVSTQDATSWLLPGFIAEAAKQILPGSPQASLPQISLPQISLPQISLAQISLPPNLTSVGQAKISESVGATVPTGSQTAADTTATRSSTAGLSPLGGTAEAFASSTSFVEAGNLSDRSTPVISTAGVSTADISILNTGGRAEWQPSSTTNSAQSSASQVQRLPDALAPMGTALQPESKPPLAFAATTPVLGGGMHAVDVSNTAGWPLPAAVSPGVKDGPGSAFPANPAALSRAAVGSAQPALKADQAVESAPTPTLLANAGTGDALSARTFVDASDLQTAQVSVASEIASASAAATQIPSAAPTDIPTDFPGDFPGDVPSDVQPAVSALPAAENPVSAMVTGQTSASAVVNPLVQLAAGRPALRFAGSRVAEAIETASGAGQRTGLQTSTPPSAGMAGSAPDDGLPIASQTPFSVFFSGSGPSSGLGTESAASTLPKMILPVTGATMRGSHSSAPSQLPANSGGTSAQNGSSSGVSGENTKTATGGSEGGSLPGPQPQARNPALNAASASVASMQGAAAPAPVTSPNSGSATVPQPQPAPPAEVLPKPDSLPGSASSSPANPGPAAAEIPAAPAPGPVQLAQLINRVEQSEMRIGMNTSAFGSVEVRAVVHASDVGLVIGSEKGDLRSLLANELPAIANTLQQQSLRLNSVNFMQGFAFSNNSPGGGDSQQHSFVPARGFSGSALSDAAGEDPVEGLLAGEYVGGSSGLSILA